MASEKVTKLLEEVKELTIIELAELVKALEEEFGVSAAPVAVAAVGAVATESAAEKTEFDVILKEVPADKKIAAIKIVREITGLGLKEAKELVEAAPKTIKEAVAKDEATKMVEQFKEAGSTAEMK